MAHEEMPFYWKVDFYLLVYSNKGLGTNRKICTGILTKKSLQPFLGTEERDSTVLLLFKTSKNLPHAVKSIEKIRISQLIKSHPTQYTGIL